MIGRPLRNTMRAASGSTQMLNSAAGVQFPSRTAPPIRQMCRILGARAGAASSSWAMLVSGPVGISVTGVRRRLERRAQERERTLGPYLRARLGEVGAVEPAFAVHVVGDLEGPHERRRRACSNRYVRPVEQREHPQRVARGLAQADVAADGRDAEDLELRARERQGDRERVVAARVAVEQHRDPRGYGRLPKASTSSVANRAPSITMPTSALGAVPVDA